MNARFSIPARGTSRFLESTASHAFAATALAIFPLFQCRGLLRWRLKRLPKKKPLASAHQGLEAPPRLGAYSVDGYIGGLARDLRGVQEKIFAQAMVTAATSFCTVAVTLLATTLAGATLPTSLLTWRNSQRSAAGVTVTTA